MDNLEFNFFFKLCGQLVVKIFIQDKIVNLLSSKQSNAHNLIHTLSNKTLNLCSILKKKQAVKDKNKIHRGFSKSLTYKTTVH